LILKLAERTGGKPVRVHVPRLYDGLVRTDASGRAFLVDPLKGGGQKHTFLFKYRDGKILLDDNRLEQAQAEASTESGTETAIATEGAIPAADVDEAVEVIPSSFSDEDASDAPWVM
jgi:hypothetical protein